MSVFAADVKHGLTEVAKRMVEWKNKADGGTVITQTWVTFSGDTAYAVWNQHNATKSVRINYPNLSDEAVLSRQEADRLTGYAVHEMAHVWWTDLSVFADAAAVSPFLKMVLNGLEDPRIERTLIESGVAPGARQCLTTLAHSMLNDARKFDPADPRQVPFIIAMIGRSVAWGMPIPSGILSIPDAMAPLYKMATDAIRDSARDSTGTQQMLDAARKIVDWLKANQPDDQQTPPPPPPAPTQPGDDTDDTDDTDGDDSDGDAGADGDDTEGDDTDGDDAEGGKGASKGAEGDDADGEGDADGGADGDADGGSDGDAEGKGKDGNTDKGEGKGGKVSPTTDGEQSAGKGSDGAGGPRGVSNTPVNLDALTEKDLMAVEPDQAIQGLIKDKAKTWKTGGPLNGIGAPNVTKPRVIGTPEENLRDYSTMAQSVGAKVGQLSNQMARLLVSPEQMGWEAQRPSGRLDSRRMSQAMAGAENVFKTRWDKPGLETDVVLLVDLSSSMGQREKGSKTLAAVTCAIAMANAMARLHGVKFAVYGFCSSSNDDGGRWAVSGGRGVSGGMGDHEWFMGSQSATLQQFKAFDEPMNLATKTRLGGMGLKLGGSTPDASSIKGAADILRRRGADRRVLVVMTDGQGDNGPEGTKAASEYAERSGCDVIGVGIKHDVRDCYRDCVTVRSAEDLSGKTFDLIVRTIRQRHNLV